MSGARIGSRPSIRRVWVDGQQVTLGTTARGVYVTRHRVTGDRLVIHRPDDGGGWLVVARVPEGSDNRRYADAHGWCTLALVRTLADAARYSDGYHPAAGSVQSHRSMTEDYR